MDTSAYLLFIGAGNMACAMIQGLLGSNFPAENIFAYRRNSQLLAPMAQKGVKTLVNVQQLQEAIPQVTLLIFAVKPWQMLETIKQHAHLFTNSHTVVSLAAGIGYKQIYHAVANEDTSIVCAMPNTPVAVGKGVIGCYSETGKHVLVHRIFSKIAKIFWLDNEQHIYALTAIAGCGPAYYFRILEHMRDCAENLGLSTEMASALVLHTVEGAVKLASATEQDFGELIEQIVSKGSATGMALERFAEKDLQGCLCAGIHAAWQRSQDLANFHPENETGG